MKALPLCAVLTLLLCHAVPAQDPSAAPPELDPKLVKEYEALLNQRFNRDPGEMLRHLERVGTADPAGLPVRDRF